MTPGDNIGKRTEKYHVNISRTKKIIARELLKRAGELIISRALI